eukprot:6406882-Amphidinium_carterae.1
MMTILQPPQNHWLVLPLVGTGARIWDGIISIESSKSSHNRYCRGSSPIWRTTNVDIRTFQQLAADSLQPTTIFLCKARLPATPGKKTPHKSRIQDLFLKLCLSAAFSSTAPAEFEPSESLPLQTATRTCGYLLDFESTTDGKRTKPHLG